MEPWRLTQRRVYKSKTVVVGRSSGGSSWRINGGEVFQCVV